MVALIKLEVFLSILVKQSLTFRLNYFCSIRLLIYLDLKTFLNCFLLVTKCSQSKYLTFEISFDDFFSFKFNLMRLRELWSNFFCHSQSTCHWKDYHHKLWRSYHWASGSLGLDSADLTKFMMTRIHFNANLHFLSMNNHHFLPQYLRQSILDFCDYAANFVRLIHYFFLTNFSQKSIHWYLHLIWKKFAFKLQLPLPHFSNLV